MATGLFRTSLTISCCMVLVASLLIRGTHARPPWMQPGSHVFTELADCDIDQELVDLCQRCAKLTRLREAYPACCSRDLSARQWCGDYVYFGTGE